jgi:NosR/NirI family nitrous oxide reductase transcriptional regulator
VPRRLDKTLGLLKCVYLGLAIWFASRPAPVVHAASLPAFTALLSQRDFIICRFDPFVGFFRFAGPAHMMAIGAGLLALGLFVGRPYCRYLCPYGGILSLLSRLAWRSLTITPDKELDCGLCAESCPFGAIEGLRAARSSCLSCARCYNACPRHRVRGRA